MALLDGLTSGSFLGSLAGGTLGLVGTALGNDTRMDLAKYNAAMQKEFAQNSIRWKVEDAKRAGVHPMAALGVSSSSFSPVSAKFESPDFSFLKDMGQSIDREALAAKDQESRDEATSFARASNNLTLERMGLENQILEMELASKHQRLNPTQVPPALPPTNPNKVDPSGSKPPNYQGEPEIQFNPTADPEVFTLNSGNDVTSLWEDKDIAGVIPLDMWPIIKANAIDYWSRLRGKVINGYVYSNAHGGWVRVNGPYGKAALADHLGIGNFFGKLGNAAANVINPGRKRESFDPQEYARRFYVGF